MAGWHSRVPIILKLANEPCGGWEWWIGHEIRSFDVLHRLLDVAGGARHRAGAARFRHNVGTGALAHSAVTQVAFRARRRSAEALLRRDGSVRHAEHCGGRDEDAEA